jgi:hypothetical protein
VFLKYIIDVVDLLRTYEDVRERLDRNGLPLTADAGIPRVPNPAGVPSQAECPGAAQGMGRSRPDQS